MSADANSVNINPRASAKKAAGGYHHGDLRDALIGAGMALLEQRDSDALGLREVARAVGVSATAVYRHFPDKDALMRAIAGSGFAVMGEMQLQAAAAHPGRAAFGAMGAAYVRFALKHPAVFRLMFSRAPPRDLFSLPDEALPVPFRMLRDSAAALAGPDEAGRVVAIRAWALVHGLAVLLLDQMVVADDAMIDAVIAAAVVG